MHLEASPPPPDPQQRVHSILDDAQQMADEIMRNARRQVAASQPAPPAVPVPVPDELTDAAAQVANALRQTQELLGLGQELLTSSHGVLEALGQSPHYAPAPEPAALPPATYPHLAQPAAPQPVPPQPAPPQPGVYAPPSELAASQPGTYASPLKPAVDAQYAEPVPAQPLVHHGQVTLTAGPLDDVAAAAVLERAIEHIPAIARARVKRFVDDRAVIELVLSEAVTLAEELRRVLPYPFEVQALGRSELDIAIVKKSESNGTGKDSYASGDVE